MMKKIILSVLLLQTVLIISCSQVDKQSTSTDDSDEIIVTSEEANPIHEDNESNYEKLINEYDLENKEEVYIRRINEEKFLVGFQEQFSYQMNPIFYIYDVKIDESIVIDGQLEYIDEIRVEQDYIEFFSKGTNIINGFKKFPNITSVDIETGLTNNENIYSHLGSDYRPFYLGNFLNETKLESLKISKEKIIFNFSVSENSILAGGDHCPNIEVISENNNALSVDIENLVISDEEIISLNYEDHIKDIQVTSYVDGRGINHKVLNFQIEGYNEYSCSFETGEDGIRDLIIAFK
jgi:hypothetical protein